VAQDWFADLAQAWSAATDAPTTELPQLSRTDLPRIRNLRENLTRVLRRDEATGDTAALATTSVRLELTGDGTAHLAPGGSAAQWLTGVVLGEIFRAQATGACGASRCAATSPALVRSTTSRGTTAGCGTTCTAAATSRTAGVAGPASSRRHPARPAGGLTAPSDLGATRVPPRCSGPALTESAARVPAGRRAGDRAKLSSASKRAAAVTTGSWHKRRA
jgi:hypothetical protein